MSNVVKQVDMFDTVSATRANTSYAQVSFDQPWTYTAANYDGTKEFKFEAVISVTATGTGFAALFTNAGVMVAGSEVSTTNTTATRLRSGDILANLVDGTTYHVRIKSSVITTITTTITAARMVILQSGTVAKTETAYAFGPNSTTTSTSYVDDANKSRYFYDADQFNGTVEVYFEAFISHATAGNTASAQLVTAAGVAVSGSEVTTTNNANTTVRSGDLFANLVDGTTYKLQIKSSSGTARLRAARLVIVQSGSPTQTESYYQTNMAFRSTTNVPEIFLAYVYWDNDEWGDTTKTVMHEAWMDAASTDTASTDLHDGSAVDDTRSTTSNVIARDRSGPLTLDDNTNYDHHIRNSDASLSSFYGAYIIVQATLVPAATNVHRLMVLGVGI